MAGIEQGCDSLSSLALGEAGVRVKSQALGNQAEDLDVLLFALAWRGDGGPGQLQIDSGRRRRLEWSVFSRKVGDREQVAGVVRPVSVGNCSTRTTVEEVRRGGSSVSRGATSF
jgi:hypothetical protein